MRLAERYQLAVVIEETAVLALVVPVDGVDGVRASVGIVLSFLVAEIFLTGKPEGCPLRGEDYGLCQLGGLQHVLLRLPGHRLAQLVGQRQVVVT